MTYIKAIKLYFFFTSLVSDQDPHRRGSPDSLRLFVPWGCPHHRSSADTSILPFQQRGLPKWWKAGGGSLQAPGGSYGLNTSFCTISYQFDVKCVASSFMLFDTWRYLMSRLKLNQAFVFSDGKSIFTSSDNDEKLHFPINKQILLNFLE